jgi:arginase
MYVISPVLQVLIDNMFALIMHLLSDPKLYLSGALRLRTYGWFLYNMFLMKTVLVGVPLDLGAKNLGVDVGPNAFRYCGVVEKLRGVSIDVEDLGNIVCKDRSGLEVGNSRLKYVDEIVRVSEETAGIVDKAVRKGKKVIGLGGDNSATLGLFSGVSAGVSGDVGVIYLDAHGDMNTDKTTLSGNIHGMQLASLMGFGDKRLVDAYRKGKKFDKRNLVHIGGCDFDEAELEMVRREKLKVFFISDLLANGMIPAFKMIDNLCKSVGNIYVSLDLDSIDSVYAPGAGMPNRGGLTYREIVALANYIGKNCNVVGVDVTEYNPFMDDQYKTAELGIELIARFFGKNYSWYSNYMKDNRV